MKAANGTLRGCEPVRFSRNVGTLGLGLEQARPLDALYLRPCTDFGLSHRGVRRLRFETFVPEN